MKALLVLALVAAALVSTAMARFRGPQAIPVDRLLANAEAYQAAHPDSAEAKYILARIHYLAFARNSNEIPAIDAADNEGKPQLAANWMLGMGQADPMGNKLSDAEAGSHASAALKAFKELVAKAPENALYQLGLASLLEQITDWKDRAKPTDLTSDLNDVKRSQACESYLKAYQSAWADDSKLKSQPLGGSVNLISYEAGQGFLRLAGDDPKQAAMVAKVKDDVEQIKNLPMGAITPMVFSLQPADHIASLLDPARVVDFPLRGYGPHEKTRWLQPTTALLVWDPGKQAAITSGRQLFGGYTFQIFRDTGYDALAALDDDHNGLLSGRELNGIRAWFDANQDGKSSASEVRDLADLEIVAIATQATAHDGRHPTNPLGIRLRDGRSLPTWDWMAEPVPAR